MYTNKSDNACARRSQAAGAPLAMHDLFFLLRAFCCSFNVCPSQRGGGQEVYVDLSAASPAWEAAGQRRRLPRVGSLLKGGRSPSQLAVPGKAAA